MIITVKKSLPFQILLGICCAVPYLSNFELTFAVWIFAFLVTLKRSYSVRFIKYTFCFLSILLLAFFSTDLHTAETYFIIRDITYLLKPALGLFIGYQICRYIFKNAFETIIYIGLGISIVHILVIIQTYLIYHHISVALLREHCGYFSDYEVYALIVVLFYKNFNILLTKRRFYIIAALIGFSAFMYLSRTNFIQFVVLYIGMKGYFSLNKRAIVTIASVVVTSLALYATVVFINPKRTGSSFEEFLYKIKIAPTEAFKTRINVRDYKEFNINYRSVEIIYTLQQMNNAGYSAMIFGKGLGSKVDLKQEVFLGDMRLRYISVLHNGFMTTYLKAGILGILLLTLSLYLLFNQKKTGVPIIRQANLLIVGTSVFLLVSNWVLMGYYFTQDSKSILVGILFAYTEIAQRQANIPSKNLTTDVTQNKLA